MILNPSNSFLMSGVLVFGLVNTARHIVKLVIGLGLECWVILKQQQGTRKYSFELTITN